MLGIVCVQVGNYCGCGAGYVNALHNAVREHVTIPHRFICVTDDPSGLNDNIETTAAPEDIRGWWVKLWLFKPDVFDPRIKRLLFIDLDTIILKNIDDVAAYDGPFAGTGNFRNGGAPFSSCLMAWANGDMHQIWTRWNELGRPQDRWGDDEFIRRTWPYTVKLNRAYLGFRSYKFHKLKDDPGDARVVIFMAKPKPHELDAPWVRDAWRPYKEN